MKNEADKDGKKAVLLGAAYEAILDSIDEGIIVVDKEGRIVHYNRVQLEFDNLKMEEIVGKFTWDVYQFDKEMSTLLKVLRTGKPFGDYMHYYLTNNGQYVKVTGDNFPIKVDGEVVGAVAVYRNLKKSEEMVAKIVELQKKLHEHQQSHEKLPGVSPLGKYFTFDDILGVSRQMTESIQWAKSASATESPVFLYGETGTGKEMFAQSIHAASSRAAKPLIAINCAAIPESLLEGILFGTVKGVFTGAGDRKGLFEEADGGTLFLDEINSMSFNLQGKLLRALEGKKVRRLGGKTETPVNVRLISSCNIEPNKAVAERQLRSDLYFRLAVVTIKIPPLRARYGDISLLADHFIKHYNVKLGKNVCEISPKSLKFMEEYGWPGNVRQLKHWIEGAMNLVPEHETVLSEKYTRRYFHVFEINQNQERTAEKSTDKMKGQNLFQEIREQECTRITEALKRYRGNKTRAAEELGMSRQSLLYRLRKYKIK